MNQQNIEPHKFKKGRSSAEAAKAGRKGGIASGKARSFKALAREMLTNEEKMALIRAQIQKGKRGDSVAFKICMDIGDDLIEEQNAEQDALSAALEAFAKEMTGDE